MRLNWTCHLSLRPGNGWLPSPLTMAAAILGRTERIAVNGIVLITLYDPAGFAVFAVLCVAGVFASLARGKVREGATEITEQQGGRHGR